MDISNVTFEMGAHAFEIYDNGGYKFKMTFIGPQKFTVNGQIVKSSHPFYVTFGPHGNMIFWSGPVPRNNIVCGGGTNIVYGNHSTNIVSSGNIINIGGNFVGNVVSGVSYGLGAVGTVNAVGTVGAVNAVNVTPSKYDGVSSDESFTKIAATKTDDSKFTFNTSYSNVSCIVAIDGAHVIHETPADMLTIGVKGASRVEFSQPPHGMRSNLAIWIDSNSKEACVCANGWPYQVVHVYLPGLTGSVTNFYATEELCIRTNHGGRVTGCKQSTTRLTVEKSNGSDANVEIHDI